MVHLINSYSFFGVSLLVLLIILALTWRFFTPKWAAVSVAITVISLVVFQLTTSTRVNTISSPSDFDDALTYGKPILLEMYSNY